MRFGRDIIGTFTTSAVVLALMLTASCAHVERAPQPTVRAQVMKYGPNEAASGGIKWLGWGDKAFGEARDADKLIFLDISATWCHWCKVMAHTVYIDPRVIELLNKDFVPVYVDTDKRPDINDRYNQGGWPSISILTPDGRVIAGKTTMTADELVDLLETAEKAYKEDRESIYAKLSSRESSLEESKKKQEEEQEKKAGQLSFEIPYRVLKAVNLFVDPKYGGYGGPDKFPMPEIMQFALYVYPKLKTSKEDSPEKAIRLTLDGMAAGLLDPVEGGFFRYSTSVDWKSPHYEKLLSTNGDLLGIYMLAYQRLGVRKYLEVGDSVADYMLGVLYNDANGSFYASQAADEKYYKLDYSQRKAAGAPPVDGTVYADANAKAAMGFLDAYRATGNEKRMAVGLRTVEYIMAHLYDDGKGVRHTVNSSGVLLLSDQVYAALAAVQAYQATGNQRYLKFAMDVSAFMADKFWDSDKGGFFDSYYPEEAEGLLPKHNKPQIENAKAATLLMELYYITADKSYKDTAVHTLEPYTADYVKHSFWAAPFALAVEHVLEPTYQFIVVGSIYEDGTMQLVTKAYTFENPDRVVVVLDPQKDQDRLTRLGYRYPGTSVMYVCTDNACFPPVKPDESLDKIRELIDKGQQLLPE